MDQALSSSFVHNKANSVVSIRHECHPGCADRSKDHCLQKLKPHYWKIQWRGHSSTAHTLWLTFHAGKKNLAIWECFRVDFPFLTSETQTVRTAKQDCNHSLRWIHLFESELSYLCFFPLGKRQTQCLCRLHTLSTLMALRRGMENRDRGRRWRDWEHREDLCLEPSPLVDSGRAEVGQPPLQVPPEDINIVKLASKVCSTVW